MITGLCRRGCLPWVVMVLAFVAFVGAVAHLPKARAASLTKELSVRLPLAVQVLMTGGDRHLAANLLGFRVLVADTFRMAADEFDIQAQLQRDISWLNPAHEDNYYIAAAILSEQRLIPSAQYVLRRAADARPADWTPLFYFAFNRYHFEKNPLAGAQALLEGVPRARSPDEAWAMQNMAAKWIERGQQPGEAASMVESMAQSSPPGGFRRYLQLRAERLRNLDLLRQSAAEFERRKGRRPGRIEELVESGVIPRIPEDPLRAGYQLDAQGIPVFRPQP